MALAPQPTVLLADDEPEVLASTRRVLERDGYEVLTAQTSEEAIRTLERRGCDLCVIDYKMPGNENLELVRFLHAKHKDCPVILFTGFPSFESAVESCRMSVFDYMCKPLDVDYFRRRVAEGVEWRRAEGERERLEARLAQSHKRESLDLMAGGVAHDFNNLLMLILGNAELALLDLPKDSRAAESIQEIETATHRASQLSRQMLAYTGHEPLGLEPVDLKELVRDLVPRLEAYLMPQTQFRYEGFADAPRVMAETMSLRQAIVNLAINAIEAIGRKAGEIVVRADAVEVSREELDEFYLADDLAPGRYARLQVIDDGCGMDQATRERACDPFFTTKFTGRGLGLSETMGVARAHGGAIAIESAPNAGTTVSLLLKIADEGDTQTSAADEAADWRGSGLILLVEDDPSVAQVEKRMIEKLGFRVVLAGDGLEGVKRFHEHESEIVCVVTDWAMPEMNGMDMARRIAARRPDLPIVMATGFNEDDIDAAADGPKTIRLIKKPFRGKNLAETLRNCLK